MTRGTQPFDRIVLPLAVAMLALTGCAIPPAPDPVASAPAVSRAMEAATGIPLRVLTPPAESNNMPNLVASVVGSRGAQRLSILVFDSGQATLQVLGGAGDRSPQPGLGLMHRANVVVFYAGPRLESAIRRALDGMNLG
ncbi:MAG: hypothetical protein QOG68_278 [Solirubrobacteraceae bacterium]|nr:hypothetical protein [Solirubrobacteraceae bacterium]